MPCFGVTGTPVLDFVVMPYLGFKARVVCIICRAEANVTYMPGNPPLVIHVANLFIVSIDSTLGQWPNVVTYQHTPQALPGVEPRPCPQQCCTPPLRHAGLLKLFIDIVPQRGKLISVFTYVERPGIDHEFVIWHYPHKECIFHLPQCSHVVHNLHSLLRYHEGAGPDICLL